MKTRYLVYKVPSANVEYVYVAGLFYSFSLGSDGKGFTARDWQQEFYKFYGHNNFKSAKEIIQHHGHSKVQKRIKVGERRRRPVRTKAPH